MNVLMINGSPKANGNTAIALQEMEKIFTAEGIETEIVHVGNKAVRGCIGCGKCAETGKHIYFKPLYLQWFWRKAGGRMEPQMAEELRLLPEQLSLYQKQAQTFLENILDIDQVGRDVQKNVHENYVVDQPRNPGLFCFKPVPVSFGPMGDDSCGAILYPSNIRDLIDFTLRDCVAQNFPVRRCRNCGRYFPVIGRITAEYCSRPQPSGKLCRNIAPVRKWAEGQKKNLVFQEYRREYKRHFSWIKKGRLSEEQFADWTRRAKAKKKECEGGVTTLDEFKEWLKNSR